MLAAEEAKEAQQLQLRNRRAATEIIAVRFPLQQQQPRLNGGSSGGMLPCGSQITAVALAAAGAAASSAFWKTRGILEDRWHRWLIHASQTR